MNSDPSEPATAPTSDPAPGDQQGAEALDGDRLGELPDDAALPGTVGYPPEQPLGVEDPTMLEGSTETPDSATVREWRRTDEHVPEVADSAVTEPDPDEAPAVGEMPDHDAGRTERPLVVVTGGSGLLGSRLIARLAPHYRIVSLDLEGNPHSPPDVEFICTDLTSDDSVQRAVERIARTHGGRIASVVHLAAYYDFAGNDSPLYEEVTVEGTRRLLEALTLTRLDQFVFSSTMLVHEPTEPGRPIDETAPLSASWPYPSSKVDTEEVIAETPDNGRRDVVVRLAGVYDEAGHSPPITNQIKRIHGRWLTSHFYPADLDRGQSFVHLDDAVDALAAVVDHRDELPADVELLIGEPTTVGYGELQDRIAGELHGSSWHTFEIPAWMARIGATVRERNPFGEDPFIKPWMIDRADDHYELDISRARDLIGWEPDHDVRDVVPEMIDRLRRDPQRWYRENGLRPPRRVA